MDTSVSIFWFRRDLRLEDNAGLYAAAKSGYPVLPVFIFDKNIIDELAYDDARISFIYSTLADINKKLIRYGSSLLVLKGDPLASFQSLVSDYNVKELHFNRDYEPYAISRDDKIRKYLGDKGVECHSHKDQVVYEKGEVLKPDNAPYTVFTPYRNRWISKFSADKSLVEYKIEEGVFYSKEFSFPKPGELGFTLSSIKVDSFNLDVVNDYEGTRNFPWIEEGTSKLGPHLRFGTVSIRQIINSLSIENIVFLNELIWREFFMQILYHFPDVVSENFRRKYDGIEWRNREDEFELWKNGQTGYPIVDAGIRQLNQTGTMHNRVRMISAGFLCKHLLIDWRWGEAYFAEKLLDYELSSNNGNWQWAAGTGCDAAPYFRVFNPGAQQEKFDKDYAYIKKWVPELNTPDYPEPLVDHRYARDRAIEAYKKGIHNI